MKIERLGLAAYGPFSEFELDFKGDARVELVFGANEAGKSTALRAVRGLLFGIPEQTGDAHRHPASELAIEASLSTPRGESVFVRRRKKRKDSLRDRDDAPLAEDAVTRLLGGVDAAAYERLFAFDHERLAESAEEMLKGKGDVGEALFSAGAGSSKVGAVLRSLEQEAADIFTPLARTRPLNVLIKEYRTLQAELRKTRLLPDAYLAQQDSVNRAEQEAERIRLERLRLEAERGKLSRVERALPWLGRLRVARLELGEEALPTSLPSEVSERRQSSELTREQARSELRHFQAEQIRDRERHARIHEIPKIVEVPEETLLALLASSHALEKERRALPERRAELALLREDAFELARKFGLCTEPEQIAGLTLRREDVARARRFISQQAVLAEAEQHLSARKRETLARILGAEALRVSADADLGEVLSRVIENARGAHDLAERERRADQLVERCEREAERARGRLVPAPPADLPILSWALPSDATLERLGARLAEVAVELRRVNEREQRVSERARRVAEEVQRIELTFAPPSEADLGAARLARDALVARLVDDPALLRETLGAVARADELADRLRREAVRVNELAALRAEAHVLEEERRALLAERDALNQVECAVFAEHRAGFEAIRVEPLPPLEMRAWLVHQREAARAAEALELAREQRDELVSERSRLTLLLVEALGGANSEREPLLLLREVERRAERIRAQKEARLEQERGLAHARAELSRVESEASQHERAMTELEQQCARAQASLGLRPALPFAELRDTLDGLELLAERLEKTRARATEIEAWQTRAAEFERAVTELAASFASDLATVPAESALPTLVARQREAVAQARERKTLDEKLSENALQIASCQARLDEAEVRLADLASGLGLASPEELPAWEIRTARLCNLSLQVSEAERELRELGEGRSLRELAAEAETLLPDEIAPRKREIAEELERLEQAAYQARRDAEGLSAGLLLLGGQSGADVAQRLSEVAAAIREQARGYAELRVAQGILARQLAEYRERHQGPVLERASALFSRLTLGGFRGLRVGLDAAVLECVRASGQGLAVAELSEGVRYQLYFALRLASLDLYLERGQALPLVLDDVFIHWDDERAQAGFQVLGELSRRTQVLFFTHHAHLAEVAARALGAGLRRHALPAPVRAA